MTRLIKMLSLAATAMLFGLCFSAPASAQATRTWISGVGDDVNPCSRTAPCKTWAGAISKTATGGEIDALDPVMRRQRFRVLEDFGVIDGVDPAGALTGGKRSQNPGACPQVDHTGAGSEVARDRGVVEIHARLVGQHALLLEEVGEIPAVVFAITPLRRALVRRKKPGGEARPALHPGPAPRQQTPASRETFYTETLKTVMEHGGPAPRRCRERWQSARAARQVQPEAYAGRRHISRFSYARVISCSDGL